MRAACSAAPDAGAWVQVPAPGVAAKVQHHPDKQRSCVALQPSGAGPQGHGGCAHNASQSCHQPGGRGSHWRLLAHAPACLPQVGQLCGQGC